MPRRLVLFVAALLAGCSDPEDSLQECSDLRDNDGDELYDCSDPDCSRYCADTGDTGGFRRR